jgi:hypothetical protein
MTTKALSTVGSKVYFLDTSVSPHVVIPIDQLKGFAPVGGPRKKIDKSNMDSSGCDEYEGGRAAPAEASGELVLDMTNAHHQAIRRAFKAGANGTIGPLQFYDGDSDGSSPPTIVTGNLTPPTTGSPKTYTRSGRAGLGYIADFSVKKTDNDIIRADFKVQPTGFWAETVKGDAFAKTY